MTDARPAIRFLRSQRYGVLATHSHAVPGYPFGSITPYVVTDEGELAILISTLAQHTRNIDHDPRVSLTVFDPADAADPQAGPRLTWLADARRASSDHAPALRERYLRYFPNAADYDKTHDFFYYLLRGVKARFIGGFGEIHWLEKAQMDLANPLASAQSAILDHMNADHGDALIRYCRHYHDEQPQHVTMLGIDPEGFDVLSDGRLLRIPFEAPVTSMGAARAALVEMSRRCAT